MYHSIYDSHEWMRRQGDPGFRYHAAMAALWGVAALRLANADVLPLDYSAYGRDLTVYLDEAEGLARQARMVVDFGPARHQARRLAALALPTADGGATRSGGETKRCSGRARPHAPGRAARAALVRHLVYAPLPSYAAETLPGLREGILEKDAARVSAQAAVLAEALRQAADRLEAVAGR